MIDCCLTPSEQYFSFNHEDFMELRNGTLNEFLIVIIYMKPPCNFIKLYEKNKKTKPKTTWKLIPYLQIMCFSYNSSILIYQIKPKNDDLCTGICGKQVKQGFRLHIPHVKITFSS